MALEGQQKVYICMLRYDVVFVFRCVLKKNGCVSEYIDMIAVLVSI